MESGVLLQLCDKEEKTTRGDHADPEESKPSLRNIPPFAMKMDSKLHPQIVHDTTVTEKKRTNLPMHRFHYFSYIG